MINYKDALMDTHELNWNSIFEISSFDNQTLLMYNQHLSNTFEHEIKIWSKEEVFQKNISF